MDFKGIENGKFLEEVVKDLLPLSLASKRYINLFVEKMERCWKRNCARYRALHPMHNLLPGTLPQDVGGYIVDRLLRKFLPIVRMEEIERWDTIGELTLREWMEAPEDSFAYWVLSLCKLNFKGNW